MRGRARGWCSRSAPISDAPPHAGAFAAAANAIPSGMDVYLPIANLPVNAFVIVLLGGGVGIRSGLPGVGGGFLTTPLLFVYGIPTTVPARTPASTATGPTVPG